MKRLLRLAPLLAVAALASCQVTRADVPQDLLSLYDAAQDRLKQAEADAEAALQSPDPSDDGPAGIALDAAHENIDRLEQEVNRRRVEPLSNLHPLLGLLLPLVPVATGLASKRGRKHYLSSMKNLTRGELLAAGVDVLRAWGAAHSSPESKAAANGETVTGNTATVSLNVSSSPPPSAPAP